jgi:hypothetical protein
LIRSRRCAITSIPGFPAVVNKRWLRMGSIKNKGYLFLLSLDLFMRLSLGIASEAYVELRFAVLVQPDIESCSVSTTQPTALLRQSSSPMQGIPLTFRNKLVRWISASHPSLRCCGFVRWSHGILVQLSIPGPGNGLCRNTILFPLLRHLAPGR